jgi:hypothetical protein
MNSQVPQARVYDSLPSQTHEYIHYSKHVYRENFVSIININI